MVLTFTLAAGVATRGAQDGVRTLLLAAVGCNLAWGIIDAVFYVMTNAFVRRRRARLFRAVSAAASEDAALATIRHELDPELEAITRPEDRERLYRGIHVLLANGTVANRRDSRGSYWRLRHLLSRVRPHAARRIAVPFRRRSVAGAAHLEPASDRLRLHCRFPLGAIHQRQPMPGRPCPHWCRPGAGRHRDGPGGLTPARTPFCATSACLVASSASRKNERSTQAGPFVGGLAAAARRERPTANANERLAGLVLQYFSATKCLPFSVARSSYLPLLDRLGSLTFGLRTFSNGIAFRICAMQLRRARRLSSECTICQGACLLSVAASIMSRAFE